MIYIVEDDENIGQMECYALKNSGFGTELFEDSESFFSAARQPGAEGAPGRQDNTAVVRIRAADKGTTTSGTVP